MTRSYNYEQKSKHITGCQYITLVWIKETYSYPNKFIRNSNHKYIKNKSSDKAIQINVETLSDLRAPIVSF